MALRWSDEADAVIAGDLATALAYVTPAGGVVVAPVTTAGVRDREAGTVMFTTSLAFGKKLARIRREDRVALAFHARDHGFADGPAFVLVQGRATIGWTDPATQGAALHEGITRFFGPPKSGRFWTWWMREYYVMRVPVTVAVERVTTWRDPAAGRPPEIHGPPPAEVPPSQRAPKNGVAPRLSAAKAARALRGLPHQLLGWVADDGFPAVVPVEVAEADRDGLLLRDPTGSVPHGARRAGLVGHRFGPRLTGLRVRQHTGWLEANGDGVRYAPHTEQRHRTPVGESATALVHGAQAKRGVRRARRDGTLDEGTP
ncbi:MAG: pyridoxamine 5'-phosphate oxidase family protein [Solirubrobacteraceae bacterium]|nr:pyridoxamine 5'-phosphate oxidase family protein [Solirubrobacteraceae bacterium]